MEANLSRDMPLTSEVKANKERYFGEREEKVVVDEGLADDNRKAFIYTCEKVCICLFGRVASRPVLTINKELEQPPSASWVA